MNAIAEYLKSSYAELRKVVWPTRQEAVQHTLLVIGISIALAAFLGAFDYLLNVGLEYLLENF